MCGKIREIRIPLHNDTKRQKGFVFIEFEDSKGAEKALKWNGTYLDGKKLKIERTNLKIF